MATHDARSTTLCSVLVNVGVSLSVLSHLSAPEGGVIDLTLDSEFDCFEVVLKECFLFRRNALFESFVKAIL